MTKGKRLTIYMTVLVVLSITTKTYASTFLKCEDVAMKNCQEISKGDAIRLAVKEPKSVIMKVDQVLLSDAGTLKNKPK